MSAHPAGSRELERRQLTVMFCDLVGSTALAERLDPEDLLDLIRAYRKHASDVVARYDGFVARYVGDGILAYFGYPHAHEDDAARAIHAALEIVEGMAGATAPHHPGVRIGIATGRVVVGDVVAEGAAESSTAWGATPNLAARLQTLAGPNAIQVAETTRELAASQFDFEDAGTQALKGFVGEVRSWRVVRPRRVESRFGAGRGDALAPLVARDAEMAALARAWEMARAGRGQVVLLSGEAGIGKSRVAEALLERIAADPHVALRFQCSPYHASSPLRPFIDQLERWAGLQPTDSPGARLEKLEASIIGAEGGGDEQLALFADLLSIPADGRYPEAGALRSKDRTLAALLARLLAFAGRAPVVALFEDVHWMDPTSHELLGLLAEQVGDRPALVLVTSRGRGHEPWLALPHCSGLTLERLDRHQSHRMLEGLLRGRGLPDALREQIVARTDGVPLFIEELLKTVEVSLPAGAAVAAPSTIPATLEDSLMARLDQLGAAKRVAQVGALIGREFPRDVLVEVADLDEAAVDGALQRLAASDVVRADGAGAAATFTFKHALLQDAAYASLLRARRQELHVRVAAVLEKGHPEKARAEPEVLAHHYSHGAQPLAAARWWAVAAERALRRAASAEAMSQAGKGLELLDGADASGERDRLELALHVLLGAACRAVSGFASSEAERSFTRARQLAEKLGDVPRLIDARRGLFSCYYARGALVLAEEQGRAVKALGEGAADRDSLMLGHWMLGCVGIWQGRFLQARAELDEALKLHDARGAMPARTLATQIDPVTNSLLHMSWLLWILGSPQEALLTSEGAIARARKLEQPFAVAMTLFWACVTRACCGQRLGMRALLDELAALALEHRLRYLGSCARVLEGQELIHHGRHAEGIAEVGAALAEFSAQEAGLGLPWALSICAEGWLALRRPAEGLKVVERALDAVQRNGEHHWEAELWRLKGELLAIAACGAEARACLRRSRELARHQGARSLEERALASLARLPENDTRPLEVFDPQE